MGIEDLNALLAKVSRTVRTSTPVPAPAPAPAPAPKKEINTTKPKPNPLHLAPVDSSVSWSPVAILAVVNRIVCPQCYRIATTFSHYMRCEEEKRKCAIRYVKVMPDEVQEELPKQIAFQELSPALCVHCLLAEGWDAENAPVWRIEKRESK